MIAIHKPSLQILYQLSFTVVHLLEVYLWKILHLCENASICLYVTWITKLGLVFILIWKCTLTTLDLKLSPCIIKILNSTTETNLSAAAQPKYGLNESCFKILSFIATVLFVKTYFPGFLRDMDPDSNEWLILNVQVILLNFCKKYRVCMTDQMAKCTHMILATRYCCESDLGSCQK